MNEASTIETLSFRVNRKIASRFYAAAAIFAIAGLLVGAVSHIPIAWGISILFILHAALLALVPRKLYLRLDPAGFEAGRLYGCEKILWSQVDGFRFHTIFGSKKIEIVFNGTYTRRKLSRAIAATLAGMEAGFLDCYIAPLEDVYAALESFRAAK